MIATSTDTITISDWISYAIYSGKPAALWRMPKSDKIFGAIQLSNENTIAIDQVENCPSGFVICPFEKTKPLKMELIKSDIFLEAKENTSEFFYSGLYSPEEAFELLKTAKLEQPHNEENEYISNPTLDFTDLVKKAIEEIKIEKFSKVVLARKESINLEEKLDVYSLFSTTCQLYPNAFVSLHFTKTHGLWLGATPETLLSVSPEYVLSTMSLAGTQPVLPGQNLSEIAWTQKEIEEQAMVSRYIIDCFKKIRLREFKEIGPQTIKAGRLAHLQTLYTIQLSEVNYPFLATTLLQLLHPTSAVCGMPLDSSLSFIHAYESLDRELYSGFIGPVNVSGHTHLFVNLRCAKITKNRVHLFAGAGITLHSIPEREKIETELKMRTMRRVFEKV